MDIEKLIHCLQCCARVDAHNGGCDDCGLEYCGPECQQLCGTAATALSTLQAENEEMQKQLNEFSEFLCHMTGGLLSKTNYTAQEMISAAEDYQQKVCGECDLRAENEKLRAELEQIPSCIYYKQGGLCRYGGDDPANVCVLGPCDHDVSVQDVLAELEQVKAERDAAVSWAQKYTESIDMPCVACKHNTGDYVCTAICGNCGPMGAESCKWEFDFSGELKED